MPKPLPVDLYSILSCVCSPNTPLVKDGFALACETCGLRHPIVDGFPVILHPEASVFDADDVIKRYRATVSVRGSTWFQRLRRFVPGICVNLIADRIADRVKALIADTPHPRLLIVGGGDVGAGMQSILNDPRYSVVESDIYFGPRSNLIADGHNLPFCSNSFDAVVCQAVLEHVARPQTCIDEIHRVLKPQGVFFADIPFMHPVHMGAYDFTRFSLGGLRLACRAFEEEEAGVSNGPFSSIALAIFHAARTLSSSRIWATFVWFGLPWLIFWLPHLDKLLRNRPQVSDAASGVYFIGRRSDRIRSEREVIREYWGFHAKKKHKPARDSFALPGRARPVGAVNNDQVRPTG